MRDEPAAGTFAELCKTGLPSGPSVPLQPRLSQGAEGQTFVLGRAALTAAWLLLPVAAIRTGKRRTSRTVCCQMLLLINFSFLSYFYAVYKYLLIYFRPRLKNVDRSTAQQLAVTVGNVTVIITDFKEKTRSSSTSSSTVTSSAGSEQQNQSSSGSESTDKGSSRSSTPKGDISAVNDESF